MKVLEENIGRKISDIPHSNIFTDMSPRARNKKENINKWDFIKIKSFCMAKENNIKMKRKPIIWENIFAYEKYFLQNLFFWLVSQVIALQWRPHMDLAF